MELSEAPGLPILDENPAGLTRTLVAETAGTLADLTVDVDVTHARIGDLTLRLLARSGHGVMLHDRSGGASDRLSSAAGAAPANRKCCQG